jgi:hypothetical protein
MEGELVVRVISRQPLFVMLIDKVDSGAHWCEGEKKDVQYRNQEQEPET